MNLNRIIQSLLLMLALVGIFAAMARNAYGFDFIGGACFGIAILYVLQVIWRLVAEYDTLGRSDIPELAELLLLSFLTGVFGLRAFYIYVNNIENTLNVIVALLILVYGFLGYNLYNAVKKQNVPLARNLVFLYVSLVFFLLVLPTWINISAALWFGVVGVVAAFPIFIGIIRRQSFEYQNKTITLFKFIVDSRNKAGLLFLFFLSSSLFTGLSMLKLIPSIENVDRPKVYIELINSAESGTEKPLNGRYQHEVYKEAMEKFLERHPL